MSDTIIIKLRNKKARTILEGLEAVKVIEIVKDIIPSDWPAKKKKQAAGFLTAYKQAKLAEQGKIKLKTAQSLLDEL